MKDLLIEFALGLAALLLAVGFALLLCFLFPDVGDDFPFLGGM